MNHPSTTTDADCRNCAHMHPDRDGGRWCSSPQILKARGHSIRCIWERDYVSEPLRNTPETQKCGTNFINFVRRTFV